MLLISDLVKIAAAGGGLHINCKDKMISDIIRIAAAAGGKQSKIILENVDQISVSDRIRIAAAGQGCVFFNDVV